MTTSDCTNPASELLDWHLNGTLAGEEESAVRAHLDDCQVCSDQLHYLAMISGSMTAH